MKIIVLSDTHGKLKKVYDIMSKINDPDLIIHCGDYCSDAQTIEEEFGIPVESVPGNCDGGGRDSYKIIDTPAGKIMITHGHELGAGYNETLLLYSAEEQECKAVCFGHTHVPVCEKIDGIYLINPGSLSKPRDGSSGSYAVITVEKENMYANIVYYDTICGGGSEKPKGGYIRGMLNYSDRF